MVSKDMEANANARHEVIFKLLHRVSKTNQTNKTIMVTSSNMQGDEPLTQTYIDTKQRNLITKCCQYLGGSIQQDPLPDENM